MPEMTDGFLRGAGAEIGPRIEAMLARGETVTLQVTGDSMRPTLKPHRDAAVLAHVGAEDAIDCGDILFFRSAHAAGGYSLHRAVRVTQDSLEMNGDAQGWTEWIARGAVVGRAIAIERGGDLIDLSDPAQKKFFRWWRHTRRFRKPVFAVWRGIKRIAGKK